MGNLRLRVITPCRQASVGMTGDVRERHCATCSLTVHNLSAMTETEARRLIAGSDGRLCVYYVARRDGTIVSRPRGGWIARAARALGAGVVAIAFWTAVVLLQRPWKALARRAFGLPPPAPPLAADGHVSPGLPINLLDVPARPFYERPRDFSGWTDYGGVGSAVDIARIAAEMRAAQPRGRR